MVKYQRFHPDLWTTVFNYEALGIVVSESDTSMRVAGNFRTQGDYIGLVWSSSDFWQHEYTAYQYNTDYTEVSFSFTPVYNGALTNFNDIESQPAMVVRYKTQYGDLEEKYVSMGLYGIKNVGTHTFLFNGEIELPHTWLDPQSLSLTWIKDDITGSGAEILTDYDADFVRGRFFTKEGVIPYNAEVTATYTYNSHEKYTFDFNHLYEGTHPSLLKKLNPKGIESITIPIMPIDFTPSVLTFTGESREFDLYFNDIEVVNGILNDVPPQRPYNSYRLAEGFDDEYNKNPKRLIESMRLLGYKGMINFYIGASHFYDKWGKQGEVSQGVHHITLDKEKGINHTFRVWLTHYLRAMKANGFDDIVISVSMECLQMPLEWRQLMYNGKPGQTGWEPPTSFYSPVNPEVQTYIRRITKETLDIVVSEEFTPILQLGESWFWWQEFVPGDVNTPFEGRPPCFYDNATKERFKQEMGYELPVYGTSEIPVTSETMPVLEKLRQYLGEYTIFMKSIADEYENSQFTTLFFPPSVLDEARVPQFIRMVNAPFDYWRYPNLDFIQIEDYDWVTTENENHSEVYEQAWRDMEYPYSKQHYFAGFVLKHENAEKEWKLIEHAAQQALGKGFAEVFIWAGTQIRRDNWNPKLNTYVSDGMDWRGIQIKDVEL